MPEVRTESAHVYVDDDGIVRVVNVSRREQTLDDAKRTVDAARALCAGGRRPMLLDMTLPAPQTNECRAHYALPENHSFVTALAIVTPSTLGRIVGGFIMSLQRSATPMRMFSAVAPAVAWLRQYREADAPGPRPRA